MKTLLTALSAAALLTVAGPASAKGCLKGAAVGGVGGHFVGKGHAVLGPPRAAPSAITAPRYRPRRKRRPPRGAKIGFWAKSGLGFDFAQPNEVGGCGGLPEQLFRLSEVEAQAPSLSSLQFRQHRLRGRRLSFLLVGPVAVTSPCGRSAPPREARRMMRTERSTTTYSGALRLCAAAHS